MPEQSSRAAFLKAAQSGDVPQLTTLLQAEPSLIDARSTSKGYTALHYAAMGGSLEAVELLASRGIAADVAGQKAARRRRGRGADGGAGGDGDGGGDALRAAKGRGSAAAAYVV